MSNIDRDVFRLEAGGVFKKICFSDLKKGDLFKMYESDGELVTDRENKSLFECISDAYLRDNVYTVDIEDDKKK